MCFALNSNRNEQLPAETSSGLSSPMASAFQNNIAPDHEVAMLEKEIPLLQVRRLNNAACVLII